jgi:hypothetical protein
MHEVATMKNISLLLLALTLLSSTSALASGNTSSKMPGDQVNANRLITNINHSSHYQLLERLRKYRSRLGEQRQATISYLKKNRMRTRDAIIAIALPGGLLYAAHRKTNINRAREKLARLNTRIADTDRDIHHFSQLVNSKVALQ